MNRYHVLGTIGDGSFGTVYRARCLRTGDVVAIKHIKKPFGSWAECLNLREVASLTKLRHDNIIRLREVVYTKEDGSLNFVFEFADGNLFSLMQSRRAAAANPAAAPALHLVAASRGALLASGFAEAEARDIAGQLLRSLAHMHRHGFFHRDIKPENILIISAGVGGRPAVPITESNIAITPVCFPPGSATLPLTSGSRRPLAGERKWEDDEGGGGRGKEDDDGVPGGGGEVGSTGEDGKREGDDVEGPRDAFAALPALLFKLCDFGQARETRSRPPYTVYVSTRWYRAPEVVLGMTTYNSPIDVWAAGEWGNSVE